MARLHAPAATIVTSRIMDRLLACFPMQLSALKQELLSAGYLEADEQIRLFNDNKMPLKPGCDPIQVRRKNLARRR